METYIAQLFLATGASILFLVAVFVPLEKAFPANLNQEVFRPRWGTDLLFLLGQYFIWSGVMVWVLMRLTYYTDHVVPSTFRAMVASQPWWLQAIEAIFLSDLCVYWGHRLQHRSNFLWRFHSVHHSAEHLDWLASHREHPLDSVYTQTILNLPPLVLGFPLSTIAALITFRGLWAVFIHSNVRIPLGPLKCIIGAPQLHHWHHDRDRALGNYANLSPLMDILFGTYVCPDREPSQLGLAGESAKSYWSYMIDPILKSKSTHSSEQPSQAREGTGRSARPT